jgi:hypothetical protein
MGGINMNPGIPAASAAAVLCLVVLLGAWLAVLAMRRLRARSEALEESLGALRREARVAAAVGARAVRRLKLIEQAYARVSDRLQFVERRAEGRSFDQAIDSARRGADSGSLAEQFGLSRGEAELVARMHGQPKRA